MGEGTDRHYVVHRTTNQVIGLVILLVGIALLVLVFVAAYHLYGSINANTFGVQTSVQQPHVPGTPAGKPLAGGVTAQPGVGTPPTTAALVLFAKLFALLVMGWLAGLLASKGVALATGAPYKH